MTFKPVGPFLSQITENPPCKDCSQHSADREFVYDCPVQPGIACAQPFDNNKEHTGRHGEKKKWIITPGLGYPTVEDGVQGTLRAAAGAIPAREQAEHALGRGCRRGVARIVDEGNKGHSCNRGCNRGQEFKGYPLLQSEDC